MPIKNETPTISDEFINSIAFENSLPQETKELVKNIPGAEIDDAWIENFEDTMLTYDSMKKVNETITEAMENEKSQKRFALRGRVYWAREAALETTDTDAEKILDGERDFDRYMLTSAMEAAGNLYYILSVWSENVAQGVPPEAKQKFENAFVEFAKTNGNIGAQTIRSRIVTLNDATVSETYAYIFTEGNAYDDGLSEKQLNMLRQSKLLGVKHNDVLGDLASLYEWNFDTLIARDKRAEFDTLVRSPEKYHQKYETLDNLAEAAQDFFEAAINANPALTSTDEFPSMELFLDAIGHIQRASETYHKLEAPAEEVAQFIYAQAVGVEERITTGESLPIVTTKKLDRLEDAWLKTPLVTTQLQLDQANIDVVKSNTIFENDKIPSTEVSAEEIYKGDIIKTEDSNVWTKQSPKKGFWNIYD